MKTVKSPGSNPGGITKNINMKIIEINNRKVICLYTDKIWTLSLIENGGPIICGSNFNKVKKEFKKVLRLCSIFSKNYRK